MILGRRYIMCRYDQRLSIYQERFRVTASLVADILQHTDKDVNRGIDREILCIFLYIATNI